MQSCHGCFVKCKWAESSHQAQSVLMTDWLDLVKKGWSSAAFGACSKWTCLHFRNGDCKLFFPSGIKLLCASHCQGTFGEGLCLGRNSSYRAEMLSLPLSPWWSYQNTRLGLQLRVTATEINKVGGEAVAAGWIEQNQFMSWLLSHCALVLPVLLVQQVGVGVVEPSYPHLPSSLEAIGAACS